MKLSMTPEDAAFIVTACNAHDELVDALQMVLDKALKDQEPDYAQIEAALAKVKPAKEIA